MDNLNYENPQVLTALVFGAVLTLVGLLGFGLVSGSGDLLGIFGVNTLHNVVHLASGVVGVAAAVAAGGAYARYYNQGFGAIYAVVVAVGFGLPDLAMNLLNIGMADNVLHLAIAVVLLGVGFGLNDSE